MYKRYKEEKMKEEAEENESKFSADKKTEYGKTVKCGNVTFILSADPPG